MRLVVATVAVLVLLVGAETGAAAKPKPWWWTPAKAGQQLIRWNPAAFLDEHGLQPRNGHYLSARCTGRGKPLQHRFLSFRCVTSWTPGKYGTTGETRVLWMMVRRQGNGQPCVSPAGFSKIPSGCLSPTGARAPGDVKDAETFFEQQVGTPLPATCLGFGAGFYRCNVIRADLPYTGSVTFRPQPVVVIDD